MGCSCHSTKEIKEDEDKVTVGDDIYYKVKDFSPKKGGFGEVLKLEKGESFYALKKIKIEEQKEKKMEEKRKNKFKEQEENKIEEEKNGNLSICENEVKIMERFDNEYIIKLVDSHKGKDYFRILMEYGGDFNLKEYIKNKNGLMDEKEIAEIILQICHGLEEIHKHKIVHRDLTPENIFKDNNNNNIKIGDFGVSTNLNPNKYLTEKIGKIEYRAPEMKKKEVKYNNKVDLYSLGCIIYELFTLNEYYDDKTLKKNTKIDLDKYKKKWQDLIDNLLQDDYDKRPTPGEIISFIDQYLYKPKNGNKNEIILKLEVEEKDKGNKIYFLSNEFYNKISQENKEKIELKINGKKIKKFKNYFEPEEKSEKVKIILKFGGFRVEDCSKMFCECDKLKSIDLSSFDTSKATNMAEMFYECKNLENINLSSSETNNVKNMSKMFYKCNNLKKIDLSFFDTKKVTDTHKMFYKCEKLKTIDLSPFYTKKVTNMESMFDGCRNLEKINFSSFITENVENMEKMFNVCEKLKSINLSSFNTEKVTNMKRMFAECETLTTINLSNFKTTEVKNMEKMFFRCSNITEIIISRFNTMKVEKMAFMFAYCKNLDKIDLSSFYFDEKIDMGNMFESAEINEILVNEDCKPIFKSKFQKLENKFKCVVDS